MNKKVQIFYSTKYIKEDIRFDIKSIYTFANVISNDLTRKL